MLRPLLFAIAIAATVSCALSARAQESLRLAGARIDGAEVAQVPDVLRKARDERRAQPVTLRVGDEIGEGVEITAPPRVRLELASRHGNRITLGPGARIVAGKVADRGEAHALHSGEASFSVRKALDFYQVSYRRFVATVRGTEYTVRVEEEREIAFAVAAGELEVERTGRVAISTADDLKSADSIREAERIRAGGERRYPLGVDEYLRRFESLLEAEGHYRAALESALASGDEAAVQRARENLGTLHLTFTRHQAAREELEAGLAVAKRRFGERDHADVANLLRLLGSAHAGLADYPRAQALLDEALAMHRRLHGGAEDELSVRILGGLGSLASQRSQFAAALEHFRRAHQLMAQPGFSDDRLLRMRVAMSLAAAQGRAGEFKAAVRTADEAFALQREVEGDRDSVSRIAVTSALAAASYRASDYAAALRHYEDALAMARRIYGTVDQGTIAELLYSIATTHIGLSQYPAAARRYREAADMLLRLYPGDRPHPRTAQALSGLGTVSMYVSRYEEALASFEEALRIAQRAADGKEHATIAFLHVRVAEAQAALRRLEPALASFRAADAMYLRLLPRAESEERAHIALSVAQLQLSIESERAAAEDSARQALQMALVVYGDKDHAHRAAALGLLASAVAGRGDIAQARRLQADSTAMRERLNAGRDDLSLVRAYHTLAMLQPSAQAGIPIAERALAMNRRLLGNADSDVVAVTMQLVGSLYERGGYLDKALATLRGGADMAYRALGNRETELLAALLAQLAQAQLADGDLEAALESAERATRIMEGRATSQSINILFAMARALLAAGRHVQAEQVIRAYAARAAASQSFFHQLGARSLEADLLVARGEFEPGIRRQTEILADLRRAYGSDEEEGIVALYVQRARAHAQRGGGTEAASDLGYAEAIARRLYGGAPGIEEEMIRVERARLRLARGEHADARAEADAALALRVARGGMARPDRARVDLLLLRAQGETGMGDFDAATRTLSEAAGIAGSMDAGVRRRAQAAVAIGQARLAAARGEAQRAAALYDEALPVERERRPEGTDLELAIVLAELAAVEAQGGRTDRARALQKEAQAVRARLRLPPVHPLAVRLDQIQARLGAH